MSVAAAPATGRTSRLARLRADPLVRLVPFLASRRREFALAVLLGVLDHGLAIAGAATGAYVVGRAATGAGASELAFALVVLGLLAVGKALATWLRSWTAHHLAFRILADLRVRLYDALDRVAPAYLLERRTGDLASAAMGDVELLEYFYAHTAGDLIVATLVPLGAVVALAVLGAPLAVVLLPFLALAACVPFVLAGRAAREGRRLRAAVAAVNADTVDGVQGLRELVTFGRGEAQLRRLRDGTRAMHGVQRAYGRRVGAEQAAADAFTGLGMTAVLAAAAAMVAGGDLAASTYPAVVIVAAFAFTPVVEALSGARRMGEVHAGAARVLAVLDAPATVVERTRTAPARELEPTITFEAVRFRYRPEQEDVLSGASFSLRVGETVALVGHSGAGKSTCANLLLRFWDVAAGAVRIGGVDVRELPLAHLRALVAFVPQDVFLFNASVADNIRLGRPEAGDADLEAAARLAVAHEFIAALPDGYRTRVGERGAQLSGGQRQRIAIARAFLKDAPILVMDEGVSNIDAESERALHAAMTGIRAGRTTLLIAHRLSTIRSADRVVVLERGRVVEAGTHERLTARDGPYARLLAGQRAGLAGPPEP